MTQRSQAPVLLIAYQRTDSVIKILDSALSNGVSQIFVSVDAPRRPNESSLNNLQRLRSIISSYEDKFENLQSRFHDSNLGCALHVLSSIDWAFESVEELIVLEDDCIPSNEFFHYITDGFEVMQRQPEIALVCGTQHVPADLCLDPYYKSKYSLTWGWATTKTNWLEIKLGLYSIGGNISLNLFSPGVERIYWQEGSRRAYEGYVDVWDTPLVNYLQTSNKYALLPRENLVTNIGSDSLATHMVGDNTWLFKKPGYYKASLVLTAYQNTLADNWLSRNFFRIRVRHILTTRVTRLRDLFKNAPREKLLIRWER
jgi:hypothetical protein